MSVFSKDFAFGSLPDARAFCVRLRLRDANCQMVDAVALDSAMAETHFALEQEDKIVAVHETAVLGGRTVAQQLLRRPDLVGLFRVHLPVGMVHRIHRPLSFRRTSYPTRARLTSDLKKKVI